MKISASIVLYNTDENQLNRILDCIIRSKVIDRVFLVDNSPIPKESISYHLPIVSYIHSKHNLGYGAGHNIAITEAMLSSNFHFVLNPDIYFEPVELQKMIDRIIKDDSIGQLMPKVIYPDGNLQYLCKLIPTPFDLFFRRFFGGPLKIITKKRAYKYELRFTGYNQEMNIPCLSGCFMLFRMSALKEIGLFDERFFMYTEDFDITRRMHYKYRTIFFPKAIIVHEHAKESYKSNKMLIIHIISVIKYFNKWGWFFDTERRNVNRVTLELLK